MAQVMWYSREDLNAAARARVRQVPVVMDVGPGIRPQQLIVPQLWLLVEPHRTYIDVMRRRVPDGPQHVWLNGTWDAVLPLMPDRSVDTIVGGDFIEHLPKQEGLVFLMEAERIARQQIILFTPLGFQAQGSEDAHKPDRWGMDGGPWQMHRSGWEPSEFDDDWECLCCAEYHFEDGDGQPLEKGFGAFYAIRTITERLA